MTTDELSAHACGLQPLRRKTKLYHVIGVALVEDDVSYTQWHQVGRVRKSSLGAEARCQLLLHLAAAVCDYCNNSGRAATIRRLAKIAGIFHLRPAHKVVSVVAGERPLITYRTKDGRYLRMLPGVNGFMDRFNSKREMNKALRTGST